MATRKNSYITAELDWAEEQLRSWKQYIDNNPYHQLVDRKDEGKTIATIEQQGKHIQETMKNYLSLLEVVDKLRQQEEAKQLKIRGTESLSPFESGDV